MPSVIFEALRIYYWPGYYPQDTSLRGQAPYITSELYVARGYELDEITKVLYPDHKVQKQRHLVLDGMGGIGKTQLAIAYAESGRGSYSSGAMQYLRRH